MFCDGPEAVNQHTKNPWDETTWAESVRFEPKCFINRTNFGNEAATEHHVSTAPVAEMTKRLLSRIVTAPADQESP